MPTKEKVTLVALEEEDLKESFKESFRYSRNTSELQGVLQNFKESFRALRVTISLFRHSHQTVVMLLVLRVVHEQRLPPPPPRRSEFTHNLCFAARFQLNRQSCISVSLFKQQTWGGNVCNRIARLHHTPVE